MTAYKIKIEIMNICNECGDCCTPRLSTLCEYGWMLNLSDTELEEVWHSSYSTDEDIRTE